MISRRNLLRMLSLPILGLFCTVSAATTTNAQNTSWESQFLRDRLIPQESLSDQCSSSLARLATADERAEENLLANDLFLRVDLYIIGPRFWTVENNADICCTSALYQVDKLDDATVRNVVQGLVRLNCAEMAALGSSEESRSAHLIAARRHFAKAADSNDPRVFKAVSNYLGLSLRSMLGSSSDSALFPPADVSVAWLSKEASRGNRFAMGDLAIAYKNGIGVDQDEEKAQKLIDAMLQPTPGDKQ